MNISEVREKYPQYGDMSDEQLGQALHSKFYSDMPYEDFAKKAGIVAEKKTPTPGERASAAAGGLNRGVSLLLGMPMDTASNVYNLAKAGVGTVATAAGRPDLAPNITTGQVGTSEWFSNLMNRAGIGTGNPNPQDKLSQFLHTGGTILGASAIPQPGGVAATARSAVPSAIGGATAEQIDPRLTGLGAMTPAVASQVAANAKNAIAAKTAPIVETFKQAGTMPSVGQATDNVFLHGLENLASKFPGGAGVMKSFIERQQKQIGDTARTGVSTEAAGREIEKGITGGGGFLETTKKAWLDLDKKVAEKVPAGHSISPVSTTKALDELVTPVPGAEKTTSSLINPKIAEMKKNLSSDLEAGGGVIPFEALRALRSRVGSMLDDALVSGIPNGELKRVYGALSKDLGASAKEAGAGNEFARQNNYYRARMSRIEDVLDRVIGKGKQPEDIFKTFNPTDPDQSNKVRAVMRSLKPDERRIVSEAVANRLGRATPGKQNEFGEVFSSETFLTNWNKLSRGAKEQLFPEPPPRENMNKIANVAANIRSGMGIYANPSGTAGSFAAYSVYLSPLASVAAASFAPLVAAAGAAGAANVGAKMMTSPKVVDWLAKAVQLKRGGETAHLARLIAIYNESKDEGLKKELSEYTEKLSQAMGSKQ